MPIDTPKMEWKTMGPGGHHELHADGRVPAEVRCHGNEYRVLLWSEGGGRILMGAEQDTFEGRLGPFKTVKAAKLAAETEAKARGLLAAEGTD